MSRFLIALALAVFALSSTVAAPLGARGEWESSGAPPLPYIPDGELNYHCDLKISHQVGSRYESVDRVRDLSTAEFHRSMGSAWVDLRGDSVPWVNGQSFMLSFRKPDEAVLWVRARLPAGSVPGDLTADSSGTAARAMGVVQASVSVDYSPPSGPRPHETENLSFSVACRVAR